MGTLRLIFDWKNERTWWPAARGDNALYAEPRIIFHLLSIIYKWPVPTSQCLEVVGVGEG